MLLVGCTEPPFPLLPTPAASTAEIDPALGLNLPEDTQIGQYDGVEFVVAGPQVDNPYDPAQADLRAYFHAPSGAVQMAPAFWSQPFDRQTRRAGVPGWRLRFTPHEAGKWHVYLEDALTSRRSATVAFTVTPAAARGFVRIDAQNPRYFAYDNGEPMLVIGLNMGWSNGDVLADYERWFDVLSQNGGNMARVWMASWAFGIEWRDTGLGDYRHRMYEAWLLDQLFQMAEARGITIMLTLINHGAFSTSVNPEWEANPYNAVNGGPLSNPAAFVEDAQAKALFKRRLRYIAARWAYSPSLFAWEWWNEVNWTGIDDRALTPWLQEMTPVLREFDPYDHLITNSFSNGAGSSTWALPEIDLSQQHDYTGGDLLETLTIDQRRIANTAPGKPLLMAELGYSAGAQIELDAMHLHTGLWAAPFLGYAGGSMYWWWDTFVDVQDQWRQFGALARFFAEEDVGTFAPGTAEILPEGAQALVLQKADRALVWVRSDAYSVPAAQAMYDKAIREAIKTKQKLTDWRYEPAELSGLSLSVPGLNDGDYLLRWYNPETGEWGAEEELQIAGSAATVTMPTFHTDLAFKIVQR
ncbi:MAG: DUF5060 domain-containing protein [Caldilineaceae bacterium]